MKRKLNWNWKRNGTIAVMLVLVGTAVFFNWKYANQEAQETGKKILGEAELVSGGDNAASSAAGSAASPDESSVYTGSDYFASARLTRQQARDSAVALLQQAADEENADAKLTDAAAEGIQVLASYTMTEAQIENIVTAKGYAECVAFMGEDSISVVVSSESGELTGEDVAKITDITMTETGYPASSIKIMPAN